jgi:hypothetical protein
MAKIQVAGLSLLCLMVFAGAMLPGGEGTSDAVSYKNRVAPLLAKHCMPCHAEENANKSEFFLDSYASLMKGGKHGVAVVPGNPEKSDLLLKLSETPPYGDRMPLQSKRKLKVGPPVYLSDDEVAVLRKWIADGAKEN